MYFTIKNKYGVISYFDNDEEMLKQRDENLFFEQHYVLSYLKEYITESKIILDIGAHWGYFCCKGRDITTRKYMIWFA